MKFALEFALYHQTRETTVTYEINRDVYFHSDLYFTDQLHYLNSKAAAATASTLKVFNGADLVKLSFNL